MDAPPPQLTRRPSINVGDVDDTVEIREAVAVAMPRSQPPSRSGAPVRSWDIALLVPAEPGRRNRRPVDATLLFFASLATGLAAVAARGAPDVDVELAAALSSILGWAPNFWRAAFVLTLFYALLIIGDVLLRRRWRLALDLLVAAVAVLVVGSILGQVVNDGSSHVEAHLFSNWGFPEFRLSTAVAVFAVASPASFAPHGCSPSGLPPPPGSAR